MATMLGASHQVLVVDDDADIREAIHDVLVDHGWQVSDAADGLDAKRLLDGGLRPCAIVLDLMMPRMNGEEFLGWLRGDAGVADIPVVVLSAMPHPELAGADGTLRKPVQLAKLLEAVERFCAA